ncbi:MAG: recO [Cyanobacteria bacterium RYN_339]|nr:recO [Cyanobacteria bacterium RYN_339]
MDSARSYTVQGIVLRHYVLGENDKILVLFTRDQGLKRVVGKGMRKANTRIGGRLEPLRENQIQLAKGRSMDVVVQAEGTQRFPAVMEDLDRLAVAIAAAEVLMAFLEEDDPAPEIYDLYVSLLAALVPGTEPQVLTAAFELQVLDLLGYRPELDACLACERAIETGDEAYALNIEAGGVICDRCGPTTAGRQIRMSAGGWRLLRQLQETPLDALAGVTDEPRRLAGMRRALREYLGFRAEKDLKAQGMFEWIPTTAPA